MSTNFEKYILKREGYIQIDVSKWINEPTHRLTDYKLKFISTNLWDESTWRSPLILENLSWKLIETSKFKIFHLTNEITDRHTDKKIILFKPMGSIVQ